MLIARAQHKALLAETNAARIELRDLEQAIVAMQQQQQQKQEDAALDEAPPPPLAPVVTVASHLRVLPLHKKTCTERLPPLLAAEFGENAQGASARIVEALYEETSTRQTVTIKPPPRQTPRPLQQPRQQHVVTECAAYVPFTLFDADAPLF